MIRNGLSVNRGISAPKDVVNIESLEFLKRTNGGAIWSRRNRRFAEPQQ